MQDTGHIVPHDCPYLDFDSSGRQRGSIQDSQWSWESFSPLRIHDWEERFDSKPLIIWLYSSLMASLPVMGWQTDEELVHIELCYVSLLPLFYLPISVLNLILLITVTSGIYLIVSSYHKNVDIDNSRRKRSTEEKKMYLKNEQGGKTIFYLVGALFCCWLPCSCASLLSFLCRSVYIPFKVFVVRLMVGYLNSALNPFLLTFLDKKFRAAVSG